MQRLGHEQGPGQGVDAADVTVEQVAAVEALAAQLGVEVEPAVLEATAAEDSSSTSESSSTEFGNWSVSHPFCGSPRLASTLPKIPLPTA